jgi:hypothetical protein
MDTNILINNSNTYTKIYHISDIHIRNTEDHVKIYQHVFNNLYKYLNSVKSTKSLIVITGDILHNKDKLTTTCETLCVDFLEKLASLMTTIVIPGNHDFNEKANTKEDSLTTILYKRPFDNLYYLKYSGVYKFNNILFGYSSLIDNIIVKASDINDEGMKIGLYHGPVANSKNSKGFEFSKKSITNFEDYDLALLGDIHYHQYLNEQKTIAYASSLISQNFSETDLYHGVLVWDLKNKSSFYKIIENNYRYDEIELDNNEIFYKGELTKVENLELPLYGKLRINTINSDQDIYNKTYFNIKTRYPELNIVHNKLLTTSKIQESNRKEPESQTITLQSIVDTEINKLPEESKKYIQKTLLKEIKIAIQSVDEKLNWRLLTLEFSNMFSYGPNNRIDFTKLTFDEITGLFGSNSIGKSSLIDILLFSLYDDYSRNYQDRNKLLSGTIINSKEKNFSCKVSFCVDNTIYFIEKEGKRMAAKSENSSDTFKFINYDFYKIEENNKIQLNGIDRIETLKKIVKLIGSYSDFCVSSICLQNNLRDKIDFFNMSSLEKKAFLNERLKFDIFKNIELKYKDLLKETKLNLKNIEKMEDYQNYDHNIDTQINELIDNITGFENNKIILDDDLANNNHKLNKLYQKLKYLDHSIESIDKKQIENDIIFYKNKINKYSPNYFDEKIEELYNNNLTLSSKLSNNYEYNILELIEQKDNLINNISNIKLKINKLDLIKNKDTIIFNNEIFEKEKLQKIIQLKTNILPESKVISINKFSNKTIQDLKDILTFTNTPDIDNQINETNINIFNLNNYITTIKSHILDINKYDGITFDNHIIQLYNTIKYDDYNNKYKDILMLVAEFSSNIKLSCPNCVIHSHNINVLLSKLNFHYLPTLSKIQYDQLTSYHNYIKLNNYKSILQLYIYMLELETNKLIKLQKNNPIIDFKQNIELNIIEMEQNNLLHDLNYIINSTNQEYLLVNSQLVQYNNFIDQLNIYENKLIHINQNIDNYESNSSILKDIETNKQYLVRIKLKKNKYNSYQNELSKLNNIINNIHNIEFNANIHILINQIKDNIQLITHNIISVSNQYNNNKHLYQKLVNNKNKYLKYIELVNNYNSLIDIYENIIKISGPKGIPRQIINIKLQHIEDTVNNIIYPFINKLIYITKDIEDIKVLINDGVSKYYSCGGMENFIISMAFKIAFTNTFNIPYTGIIFIDEGVSVLDKKHVTNFDIISNFIKQYYNHIILITHIDTFFDYTFDSINITKNKYKQSFVDFSNNIIKDNDVHTFDISTSITDKKRKKQLIING